VPPPPPLSSPRPPGPPPTAPGAGVYDSTPGGALRGQGLRAARAGREGRGPAWRSGPQLGQNQNRFECAVGRAEEPSSLVVGRPQVFCAVPCRGAGPAGGQGRAL